MESKFLDYVGIEEYTPEVCRLVGSLKDTFCRAFPGVFLWVSVLVSFILPFFSVKAMFIFLMVFGVYQLYVAFYSAFFSFSHHQNKVKADKTNFRQQYEEKREKLLKEGIIPENHLLRWEDVMHYVIIPNYKEQITNLEEMLEYLVAQQVAKKQMIIVMAFEEREGRDMIDVKFKTLYEKFSSKFLDFVYTIHPGNIAGELAGKSSNEAWAAKQIFEDVKKRGFNKNNVLLSVSDADSQVTPKHYDFITSAFANDPTRGMKIYQAGMACIKNYWQTPGITRVITTAVTLHEVACLGDPYDIHLPFSTYSIPLTLVNQVGGWDTDVIAEDWHMYIKCWFKTNGKAEVVAVPAYVPCYAVEGNGMVDSIKKRYTQAMRHSWGISEISYFLQRWYLSYFGSKEEIAARPDFLRTFILFFKYSGIFLFSGLGFWIIFWPSLWVFLCNWFPSYMPAQAISAVWGLWGLIYQALMGLAGCCFLAIMVGMVTLLKEINHEVPKWTHYAIILFDFVVWSTFTQLLFSGYPTFVCATRLFYTDRFVYVVAAKPTTAIEKEKNVEGKSKSERSSEIAPLVKNENK